MMKTLHGAGLGFRREMLSELRAQPELAIDFFEVAPENWIDLGGQYAEDLRYFSERYPFICHGLSLSLGGTESLDMNLLGKIKTLIKTHNMPIYTEHLSWCTDDGHLYDLLPIPFTEQAISWVVDRIQQVQNFLGMRIGIENVSYYVKPPEGEMSEELFINEIVRRSGCYLHLDVNNIYVNSQNFGFDPYAYLAALPLQETVYIHVAGHYTEPDGLIIDTHGANVIDPVWALLHEAYGLIGNANVATCLERDFNYPGLPALMEEVNIVKDIQQKVALSLEDYYANAQRA